MLSWNMVMWKWTKERSVKSGQKKLSVNVWTPFMYMDK